MNHRAFLLTLPLFLVACSSAGGGGTGGSGGSAKTGSVASSSGTGTGGTSSSSTTSSTSSSTTSTTSTSGSTCAAPKPLSGQCAPGAACMVGGSTCLAHVDQATSTTPGFRMAQIAFTKPAVFNQGVVASVLQGAVAPNDQACNLDGSGTLDWLLRFDTTAGTLTTGGAKPAASPSGPYSFDDEMIMQGTNTFHVQPVTLMASLTASCTFDSTAGDVNIPAFLNGVGSTAVVLPLRSLRLHAGTMTPDHGCIGRYDAEGLQAANACQPDPMHAQFTGGASADGYMLLEEADRVVVTPLQETLCVLISGNAAMYGTPGPGGATVCKRDASNTILFHGDFCSTTDGPATATCFDSAQVSATFAAQAVQIQ